MVQSSIVAWLTKSKVVRSPIKAEPAEGTELQIEELHAPSVKHHSDRHDEEARVPPPASDTPSASFREPWTSRRLHIHPNARLAPLTQENLPSFKRLNALLLPIAYPQKFYDEIFADDVTASITRIVLWSDGSSTPRLVGGIRCRLLQCSEGQGPVLYISTLGTLSPFRRHGLASALLQEVTCIACQKYGIASVEAHVWAANGEALQWYAEKGFEVAEHVEGYYRRLNPSAAVKIRRRIGVMDALKG